MWELIGFGGILLILLVGLLLKDWTAKYRMRLVGYGYMVVFELFLFWSAKEIGWSAYHACLVGLWVWMAYKDIKTTRQLVRSFARLEQLRAILDSMVAQLFYHRRN